MNNIKFEISGELWNQFESIYVEKIFGSAIYIDNILYNSLWNQIRKELGTSISDEIMEKLYD